MVHIHNIVSIVLVESGLVLNGEGVVADPKTVRAAEVQLPFHLRPIGRVDQSLLGVKVDHPILSDDGEVRIVQQHRVRPGGDGGHRRHRGVMELQPLRRQRNRLRINHQILP